MKWKIRFTLLLTLLLLTGNGIATVDHTYVDRVVAAIYWAEGGPKTKYAFGIKTVKVANGQAAKERCQWLVANCFDRWDNNGRNGLFLETLQRSYCPTSGRLSYTERRLNGNWLKNVRFYMENPKPLPSQL